MKFAFRFSVMLLVSVLLNMMAGWLIDYAGGAITSAGFDLFAFKWALLITMGCALGWYWERLWAALKLPR